MKIREIPKDFIPVTIQELYKKPHPHKCNFQMGNRVFSGSINNINGTTVELQTGGKIISFDIYDVDTMYLEEE